MNHPLLRRQHGGALVESLLAFVVMSLGMVLVAKMQSHLRLHSDLARQRTEAVRLAQREIETLRAFSVVGAYAGIASATSATDASGYTLTRTVDAGAWVNAKAVAVRLDWTDRTGTAQRVVLNTIIDGGDPAVSAALGLAPIGWAAASGEQAH